MTLRNQARRAGLPLLALLSGLPMSLAAQVPYPNRPVKIIAPQAPGGGVDLVGRILADRLEQRNRNLAQRDRLIAEMTSEALTTVESLDAALAELDEWRTGKRTL